MITGHHRERRQGALPSVQWQFPEGHNLAHEIVGLGARARKRLFHARQRLLGLVLQVHELVSAGGGRLQGLGHALGQTEEGLALFDELAIEIADLWWCGTGHRVPPMVQGVGPGVSLALLW